jgi:hypothetical protein
MFVTPPPPSPFLMTRACGTPFLHLPFSAGRGWRRGRCGRRKPQRQADSHRGWGHAGACPFPAAVFPPAAWVHSHAVWDVHCRCVVARPRRATFRRPPGCRAFPSASSPSSPFLRYPHAPLAWPRPPTVHMRAGTATRTQAPTPVRRRARPRWACALSIKHSASPPRPPPPTPTLVGGAVHRPCSCAGAVVHAALPQPSPSGVRHPGLLGHGQHHQPQNADARCGCVVCVSGPTRHHHPSTDNIHQPTLPSSISMSCVPITPCGHHPVRCVLDTRSALCARCPACPRGRQCAAVCAVPSPCTIPHPASPCPTQHRAVCPVSGASLPTRAVHFGVFLLASGRLHGTHTHGTASRGLIVVGGGTRSVCAVCSPWLRDADIIEAVTEGRSRSVQDVTMDQIFTIVRQLSIGLAEVR